MKQLILTTIMALALIAGIPMQAKAAEVQPTTIPLVQDGYYQEVEKDGVFNRHDAEGNLISSIKVEDASFKVNSTLTEGWGQGTIGESHIEGTFKNATLDTKGYFRCSFTTETGVVYDDVVVKVKTIEWIEWAIDIANKDAANKAAEAAAIVGANGGGNSDNGNSDSGNSNSGNSNSGNSVSRPGNVGWVDAPSSVSRPYTNGWF